MQVLLIQELKDPRELIQFFLETQFSADVSSVATFQEGMDLLLDDKAFDLIVCEDTDKSVKFFKYLMSTDSKIPCVLVRAPGAPAVVSFSQMVLGTVTGAALTDELGQIIGAAIASGRVCGPTAPSEYCRIKTSLLVKAAPLKADIFVRLSTDRHVKLFSAGDKFDAADLEKYLHKKKIEHLYLKRSDATAFMEKFNADLEKMLIAMDASGDGPEEAGKISVSVHEAVREMNASLGFTPEVQKAVKAGVILTLKSIGSSPKLGKFLKLLARDKEKYISSHSVLLAQVACGISALMEWSSETTFQKLAYAAFFHDIVFTNQELCRIDSLEELEAAGKRFTETERKIYREHPMLVSELVKRFSEIPADVDQIIFQHHERPDGKGFPRKLGAMHFSPLACIFIVAHDLVDYVYSTEGEVDIAKFLDSRRSQYTAGQFKRVIAAIDAARTKGSLGSLAS